VTPTKCVLEANSTSESPCSCEEHRDHAEEGYTCFYDKGVQRGVAESEVWRTYIVLCELLMRLIPCATLAFLTTAMARDFHVSLRRRRKLMASVFTISGSSIFPAEMLQSEKELLLREKKVPKENEKWFWKAEANIWLILKSSKCVDEL